MMVWNLSPTIKHQLADRVGDEDLLFDVTKERQPAKRTDRHEIGAGGGIIVASLAQCGAAQLLRQRQGHGKTSL